MLSGFERCVIARAARTSKETRWLIRGVHINHRAVVDGTTPVFRRVRSWRLNVAQVILAKVTADPWLVPVAFVAAALYVASFAYLMFWK